LPSWLVCNIIHPIKFVNYPLEVLFLENLRPVFIDFKRRNVVVPLKPREMITLSLSLSPGFSIGKDCIRSGVKRNSGYNPDERRRGPEAMGIESSNFHVTRRWMGLLDEGRDSGEPIRAFGHSEIDH
jgi:hypothetical protein